MKKHYSLALEQKEAAKHGEAFFPIQKYITTLSKDYLFITTHWHEEAEITLITKGNCIYQIDLVDYQVNEGDIIFIPPLILHSISRGTTEEIISETYVFHLNFLGGNSTDICSTRYLTPMMNQELSMPYIITPSHPAYESLKKIFYQINTLYAAEAFGYELSLKALLLQACFLLLQYSSKSKSTSVLTTSDTIKTVLDYIELHFSEEMTISELAHICHFSDYHFMRFFKKYMNMTCVEYINNLRLEKSVELLKQGNSSVMDVSLSVGFHNASYFHRAFKKKYHMTPLSFMKLTQNKVSNSSPPITI